MLKVYSCQKNSDIENEQAFLSLKKRRKTMEMQSKNFKLENFDDVWGQLGDPVLVEKKFIEFLPQAQELENKSIYLQLMSQLALAQAVLKKFDQAHATLDQAQAELTSEHDLARVRVLCERGRTFQQAGDFEKARVYFERSYELSLTCKFDKETINAAHMIAIVAKDSADKIAWNQRALDIALTTEQNSAQNWRGPILNNLGANYLAEKQYEKALDTFKQALVEFEKTPNYGYNIRFAKFRIAQVYRLIGRYDQALAMLQEQLAQYDVIMKSGKIDMSVDMFKLMRGWLYEELIEIYHVALKGYAQLAYEDFTSSEVFKTMDPTMPARLERLKKIKNS